MKEINIGKMLVEEREKMESFFKVVENIELVEKTLKDNSELCLFYSFQTVRYEYYFLNQLLMEKNDEYEQLVEADDRTDCELPYVDNLIHKKVKELGEIITEREAIMDALINISTHILNDYLIKSPLYNG